MTPNRSAALLRKRLWTPADLAEWLEVSKKQARTLLKRLNAETGGMLLMRSGGRKPEYSFFAAALARAKPEVFERLESFEVRLGALEESVDDLRSRTEQIVFQTGQNSRDIGKMRRSQRAA